MFSFFQEGGVYMWFLLVLAGVIVVLAIIRGMQLFSNNNIDQLENKINTILFWGAFSVVLGFFAHFHGVYLAMQAIKQANDISPSIVAGGYAVSIITILSGLFMFMISAVIWLVYRSILSKKSSSIQ